MSISLNTNLRSQQNGKSSTLLKKATALKDEGQLADAIETLKHAFSEISKSNMDYGVEVFLRLPMYLQAAGRNDEGWREFNHLLTSGYPNMLKGEVPWHYMESVIYDKMRLFLQREKKSDQAVVYGMLSYINRQRANLIQAQQKALFRQYFEQGATKEAIERMLSSLLKKAKLSHKLDLCVHVVQQWVSALPDANDIEFEKSISEIVME